MHNILLLLVIYILYLFFVNKKERTLPNIVKLKRFNTNILIHQTNIDYGFFYKRALRNYFGDERVRDML